MFQNRRKIRADYFFSHMWKIIMLLIIHMYLETFTQTKRREVDLRIFSIVQK